MIMDTIAKVEDIQEQTRVTTKSDAVKFAIDIAALVLGTIADRGEVFLVNKDGEKTRITIPRVSL